jgi:hypothetical protein
MNEPEEKKVIIEEKDRSDSLKNKTADELRAMKAAGQIVYRLMKSKDGKYLRALDDTIYERRGGALVKVGMLNAEGNIVPFNALTKKQRSKQKREAKRNAS